MLSQKQTDFDIKTIDASSLSMIFFTLDLLGSQRCKNKLQGFISSAILHIKLKYIENKETFSDYHDTFRDEPCSYISCDFSEFFNFTYD